MKTAFALMMLVATASAALPPDAATLKGKRDAKVAEIDRIYAAELAKLQKKAMAEGNLPGATEIEKEIAKATPNPFLTGDDAIVEKLKGTSWKQSGSQKVMTFRVDGRLDKSWGKLTPEWTVKNGTVSVEDSKIKIDSDWKTIDVKGGDKDGQWKALTPQS